MKPLTISKGKFSIFENLANKDAGELVKALISIEQGIAPKVKSSAVKSLLSSFQKPEKKKPAQGELIPIDNTVKNECTGFVRWIAETMNYSIEMRDIGTNVRKQQNYCSLYSKLRSKYSKQEVKDAVMYAVRSDFWRPNFLTPMKLEKKNKDDITYMDYFLSQHNLKKYESEKNINKGSDE
jgi:hypothetical protein